MTRANPTLDSNPVFLYFDPHPVHRKMAEYIGAELVQCETGGPAARVIAGRNHEFGDRPVILEGGVPLAEGVAVKLLGSAGPIIALGADSTYHDLHAPLPNQTGMSRAAHRLAQRFVDGTIAVSEQIATIAEQYTNGPVRVVHPFVGTPRYGDLMSVAPASSGRKVLCVGKYRQKNGQELLRAATEHLNSDAVVHFVGPDTKEIPESKGIRAHGFVSEQKLIELYEDASLVVFPALAGAFPVNTLEALCAATPVVTTPQVGTATLIRGVHGQLIADPNPVALADAIDWFFSLNAEERVHLAKLARGYGAGFSEKAGLEAFAYQFHNLLDDLKWGHDR